MRYLGRSYRVTSLSLEDFWTQILRWTKKKKQLQIAAVNTSILRISLHSSEVESFLHSAICFTDGVPLLWVEYWKYGVKRPRVSGTDLVEKILEGSLPVVVIGTAERVLTAAKKMYSHSVVGGYSPSFVPVWPEAEVKKIVTLIKKTKPQFVLVGMTSPRQEKMISLLRQRLSEPVTFVTMGSALDILVGNFPRAPKLMQALGWEWAWRLWLEPRRLYRRYFLDAWFLVKLLVGSHR
jgi:N-acetylglucosaminyldiphosphoundecaprenol N-acetyl-beta-D-mannosaminyltransferase